MTEIVGGLADTPDDPTRRPDLDDYQARAAEATPPDASPEVQAQVTRMARIEQARADRAWQAARGRAATSALDWLGANPAAPLMAMPTDAARRVEPGADGGARPDGHERRPRRHRSRPLRQARRPGGKRTGEI